MRSLWRIQTEFMLLFVGLPLFAAWQGAVFRRWIVPEIWLLALVCWMLFRRDQPIHWQARDRTWSWPELQRILALFLVGAAGLLLWVLVAHPVEPFAFPRQRPWLWGLVVVLYPFVSALAQEFIFRVFLFHRYRDLWRSNLQRVLVSAAVFGWAHLMLGNWQAPVLSFAGGLLFAATYARTGSWWLVTLEHGLWGDWLFTIGLGRYFYGGHA